MMPLSPSAEDMAIAAATALSEGDGALALRWMAQRFGHPIILPTARDYLLRARALEMVGRVADARQDIDAAYRSDPFDPLVLARGLAGSEPDNARRAAIALVSDVAAPLTLRREALLSYLADHDVLVQLQRLTDHLDVWAYWRKARSLFFDVEDVGRGRAAQPIAVEGLVQHAFFDVAQAAHLSVALAEGDLVKLHFLDGDGTRLAEVGPFGCYRALTREGDTQPTDSGVKRVLIVVPVFDDADATRQCLDSVLAQSSTGVSFRLVIVDDASRNAELVTLIEAYRGPRVEILTNPANLGFSSSVNHALSRRLEGEDILLLNADAFLPPGGLARLQRAAYSKVDIGTVTPFSNNGEHCSLPIKNLNNPINNAEDILAFDRIADAHCYGSIVDIPNGVGFCLYVRHDVIDRIGGLSDDFGRGYYEDVDFCLRARAAGFRNVCAVDVVVGHWGSRSFRADKHELVHRNLRLLARRYPHYRAEFAAFLKRDPLAAWRQRILQHIEPKPINVLLVADALDPRALLQARSGHLQLAGSSVQIMLLDRTKNEARFPAGGDIKHDQARFSLPGDQALLTSYLRKLSPRRAEAVWPTERFAWLDAVLGSLDVAFDPLVLNVHPSEAGAVPDGPQAGPKLTGRSRPHSVNTPTFYYALRKFGMKAAVTGEAMGAACETVDWARRHLCIIMPDFEGQALALCEALSLTLRRSKSQELTVFGDWLVGQRLARLGNVTILPYDDPLGLDELLRSSEIGAAVLPYRTMLGEPEHDVLLRYGLPCAFFDFSGQFYSGRRDDCRLSPRWSSETCARTIVSWYERLLSL